MDIYSASFPHYDETVLYAPEKCEHCDHYPILQNVRINNAISFSGEDGSPDEKFRSREVIDKWGGNRAAKGPLAEEVGCQVNLITGEHFGECRGSCGSGEDECNHPMKMRGVEMKDGSFLCFACRSWILY